MDILNNISFVEVSGIGNFANPYKKELLLGTLFNGMEIFGLGIF